MTMPMPARARPGRQILEGRLARLEPLDAARHGASLWREAAGADALWDFMAFGPFADEAAFRAFLSDRAADAAAAPYAIVERATGRALGFLGLMRIDQANGVIEIGGVVLTPAMQRSALATEAMFLTLRHVFEGLGYRRCEWKCDEENALSKSAALRLGFSFEGIFRQHMIIKGENRDTAWFAMLDRDWPERKAALEAWLAPENFDAQGRQRTALSAAMGRGAS